jgi:hypothetical protein
MISRISSSPALATLEAPRSTEGTSVFTLSAERLLQVGLFLYLLPVLLLVLAAGMIGMVVLSSARFLQVVVSGPSWDDRNRAGLESLRS